MSERAPRPRYSAVDVRRRRVLAVLLLVLLVAAVAVLWPNGGGSEAVARAAGPAPSSAPVAQVEVVQRGSGVLDVVPGSMPAPGRGEVVTVRVDVERGTGIAAPAFAAEVMSTLNDPRSWGQGGTRTFARTDGTADVQVILASPLTSADLCRPLVTYGRLSCSEGERAILTSYRWEHGTVEFPDLAVYRRYVVNHEVGHVLGKAHERCPAAGLPAPVMQQQTIGVAPCTPNAWPFP